MIGFKQSYKEPYIINVELYNELWKHIEIELHLVMETEIIDISIYTALWNKLRVNLHIELRNELNDELDFELKNEIYII